VQFNENLSFSGNGFGLPDRISPGPLTFFNDQFNNRNNFYGGQFGVRGSYNLGRLSVGAAAKLALGVTYQSGTVDGAITTPGGTVALSTRNTAGLVFPGGVFAQPSNLSSYSRDVFTVVPEGRFDLGYAITSRLRCTLGYTFLCISNVARPGDQIDPVINLTRTNLASVSRATVGTGSSSIVFPIPQGSPPASGPIAPTYPFRDSTFWAQGINVGLEYAW
jgi:hypothetical protein